MLQKVHFRKLQHAGRGELFVNCEQTLGKAIEGSMRFHSLFICTYLILIHFEAQSATKAEGDSFSAPFQARN